MGKGFFKRVIIYLDRLSASISDKMNRMNVYDFDETIFDGDSELLFSRALIDSKKLTKEHELLLLDAWKNGDDEFIDKVKNLYFVVKDIENLDSFLEQFWDVNEKRIKAFYKNIKRRDDVISSATPRFILEPIMDRLGIKHLLATELNEETYGLKYLNKGQAKVESFEKAFKRDDIESFYSDSDSDLPLAKLAKKAYKVQGENVSSWID